MIYPARATKTVLLRLLTLHRQGPYLEFLESIEKATAVRTLESLARIEARRGGRSSRGTHNYHPHRQGRDRYHYGA